jgi:hypothetical protein
MADYPPLSRFYVASYAANDRDYPVVAIRLDPRTAGYRVPEDLSPHPDGKRYPNHVFTGAQPASGDQVVTHIYEILPAPYVPFTRYDDDLGPIQGRRRSVKNEGQVARLGPDQRVNYEAREGSAIVYTEIEEAWSIATDDDGNSLFPIRDRDFYDASRGAVQERRQLFVPTGEEVGTLENINGVITQTSYEPYNEYLSVKIVQTYKVDGPQLIGRATDEARQLATVTTQRKGSADYVPPNPTATRTVEVSSEDAESLVERIVEVPEVFGAEAYRKTKEDITPQKFKAAQEDVVFEQTIEGTANPAIVLGVGEFVRSEEQVNKFTKRVSTTSRSITSAVTLLEKVLTPQGQVGTRTLTLAAGSQSFTPSETLLDASIEALGDGRTVKTEVRVPNVFPNKTITKTKIDTTPEKFKAKQEDIVTEESIAGTINQSLSLSIGEFRKSEEQVTEFVKRTSVTSRDTETFEDLTEYIVTPQGQLAERRLFLSSQSQTIEPEATLIDGSIEELGDGRTLKTEVRVSEIFNNKTLSVSRPEVLPERFRASVPSVTTQEIIEQNSVSVPELDSGDLEKSETRITDFTVRKSTTTRDVSTTPTLDGMDYEESFDVQIPYTETIQQTIPTGSAEAVPLDDENFLVREYNANDIGAYLSSFLQTYPTTISINLPRVLESITVEWDEKQQSGEYVNTPFAAGILYQFSNSDKGESSAFHSATPLVSLNFKDVWSQNIPATVHIFFLKNPVTEAEILGKTGSQKWPTFKPKSHVITGKGVEIRATASAAASISVQQSKPAEFGGYTDQSRQGDYSRSVTPITINIPPCLHGGFNINETKELTVTAATTARTAGYGIIGALVASSAATANDTAFIKGNLGATSPSSIPISGKYLIESSVEFFKYGFSIVRATTINASVFA